MASEKPTKRRIDELLVEQGLCESRSRAKALVLAGKVRLGTERIDKPGRTLPETARPEIEIPPRFVSRGGEKLEGFLDHFSIAMEGCHLLDVGASTGGFTDCALQRGALGATCVDVGRAQLHNKLLRDPRVTNLEKLNARHLSADDLPRPRYPRIVMDLSFISLRKVLPAVWPLLEPDGCLVALVKPQFEARREEVDAGRGIIRDTAVQERIRREIEAFALSALPGATCIGSMESPICGTDGNREFLIGLSRSS